MPKSSTKASPKSSTKANKLNKEIVDKLVSSGENLNDSLADEIIAAGAVLIPDLIAIMQDEDLADVGMPGEGCVPLHALELLKRMKAADALEPMLELIGRCDPDDALLGELISAVKTFGETALEPGLKFLDQTKAGSDHHNAILDALSGIGVKDERLFEALLKQLDDCPYLAAGNFVEYNNPAVLPHLVRALDKCKPLNDGGEAQVNEILELSYAIETFDGRLTKHQTKLVRGAKSFQARQRARVEREGKKVGFIPLTRPGVGVKVF